MTSEIKVEAATSHDGNRQHYAKSAVVNDNVYEHHQTIRMVASNHPALAWWAFFFSVSAIGWYWLFLKLLYTLDDIYI